MTDNINDHLRWYHSLGMEDTGIVGGKNASLGELIKNLSGLNINVPDGFATTAGAFRFFLEENELSEKISAEIERYRNDNDLLKESGYKIRELILHGIFPTSIANSITGAYELLCKENGASDLPVAVRSSATAEDLPGASFAGLHDTFLNVRGKGQLLEMCKRCYASLFTDRAIIYREQKGFEHMEISLSVGIQRMISAENSGSGVMFTLDTESGFPNVILINAAWGLGENIVQGTVNPDQYLVFKPLLGNTKVKPILEKDMGSKQQKMIYASENNKRTRNIPTTYEEQNSFVLNDEEILQLSSWAKNIEDHYQRPMDIEWVKDDRSGELYIVQARPETIHASENVSVFKSYTLNKGGDKPILKGINIGSSIATGIVKKVSHINELKDLPKNTIIVTEMTEPDWVPILRKVNGIITNSGGRTCHAAIISRELGIPAIVGTTTATTELKDGMEITISCAGGDEGLIYSGILDYEVTSVDLSDLPDPETSVMINLASPETAFNWWRLPVDGIGLARMEFIISNHIKIHPMALIDFDRVKNEKDREYIRKATKQYQHKTEFFIEKLREGISRIAASQYPKPVIVRTSDFKTNEYSGLIGGKEFEPEEDNPMIGWRGASRYYSPDYTEGFSLECEAIRQVRDIVGLDNVIVMIPFCRTLNEAKNVKKVMAEYGLGRGVNGLQIYMMCEIPSNVILAEEFSQHFDGMSIGSNDLTQLILGVDRDSVILDYLFDENDKAVKKAITDVIKKAHFKVCPVGFCGQAPSDDPNYAAFLVKSGIDSLSVNPDCVVDVIKSVYEVEQSMLAKHQDLIHEIQ
ncbi:phosphoenolpyruvate synthase [Balneola sp. MJW-20]|uniref:phosphoenolpyruvate synthase n=1 Tax=Gracilimonas aurantiaca TaxID=3234185 RepID=UPI0034675CD0